MKYRDINSITKDLDEVNSILFNLKRSLINNPDNPGLKTNILTMEYEKKGLLQELENTKNHIGRTSFDIHIAKIDEAIKNGEISAEDREKEIKKIPKFHAHALRKFFQTTIARNCGNLRICALMEGHTTPLKTDPSYIQIGVEEVKEAYLLALPDLSLENVETKTYTSEVRREMEAKIQELERKNELLESEVSEIDSIKERLNALERPSWNEFVEGD